jgi:hypothetical protein
MSKNIALKLEFENDLDSLRELVESVSPCDEEISSLRKIVQDFVNDLSSELFFDIDVQRLINKFLWETRDVLGFSEMSDAFIYEEGFVEEMSFGKLNVKFFNSTYNFVLPDDLEGPIISGNGNGIEKKNIISRVNLMYELLRDWGVENVLVYEGKTLDSQFRKVPYRLFIIEELDRAVLICEESGNRTFVKAGLSDLESFSFSKKSELKQMNDVRSLIWCGAEHFKEKMAELLVLDFEEDEVFEEEEEVKIEESNDSKKEYPKMDREYFSEENVRQDLDAYCAKAGLTDVSELSTSDKFTGLEVVCSNGETVMFQTYLSRASVVLSDKKLTLAQALDTLKKIYGLKIEVREVTKEEYPKMDREYFSEENVRRDLEAYCGKAGLNDVSELSKSDKFTGLEVVCSNGEPVKFNAYLSRASVVLSDKKLTLAQALDALKKIYGLKIDVREVKKEEYPMMDREYFSEENVRRDLEAYCGKAGLNDVSELRKSDKFTGLEVVCSNGEPVKFNAYLSRASVVLSDKKLTLAQSLDALKKIYGLKIEVREVKKKNIQ